MIKKKIGRKKKHRKQTLTNLAGAVIRYEKVTTTYAKGKAVVPIIERMISTTKKNDLVSRRKLLSKLLHNKNIVNKIINDIAPRFKDCNSGFVKLFNMNPRLGDKAPMVTLIIAKSSFLGNLEVKNETKK